MIRSSDLRAVGRNPALLLGALGLIAFAVIAAFGSQLAPHDPNAERWILFRAVEGPERYAFPPTAPDSQYWLGTDGLGRDLFSRFLAGAQLTFAVVGLALAARMALGVTIGAVAGYARGPLGFLARQLTLAIGSVPQLLVVIVLVLLLRDLGVPGFAAALALVGWGEIAGFTADRVRALRGALHVEAAVAVGVPPIRVARDHVLQILAPSLLGLAALEAGAVMLVLAELGVIGLFVAGATYYIDEDTRLPILPLRDRAPEWGQMLAGLRAYGNEQRYIVLIPAVVVAATIFVFNLLAEGLRAASDPHSQVRLSPAALRTLFRGAGLGLVGVVLVLATGALAKPTLDLESGLPIARETARKTAPGYELVAAAIHYTAETGALSAPAKINYYFFDWTTTTLLRVGFVEGLEHQMEVRPHQSEDAIDVTRLQRLDADLSAWDEALTESQHAMGESFRQSFPNYVVRLVAWWPTDEASPRYEVVYTSSGATRRNCCFEMERGAPMPTPDPHGH
jgi:ABC-type dipeptide/oligopeptide/nickel transport system permease subunit